MPRRRNFDQLAVDKAKPRGRRYDLSDGPRDVPGLMFRVSERGVKTFALRYRLPNGTQPRMTLDKHLTLAEARTARSAKTPAGNSLFVRRPGR